MDVYDNFCGSRITISIRCRNTKSKANNIIWIGCIRMIEGLDLVIGINARSRINSQSKNNSAPRSPDITCRCESYNNRYTMRGQRAASHGATDSKTCIKSKHTRAITTKISSNRPRYCAKIGFVNNVIGNTQNWLVVNNTC